MLREGDLAWGQIKGYPYWPCRVLYKAPKSNKYRVQFFGDNTQGDVSGNAICDFEKHYKEYVHTKSKNPLFKQAIEEAMDEMEAIKKKTKIEQPLEEEQNLAIETHETSKEEAEIAEVPVQEQLVQDPLLEIPEPQMNEIQIEIPVIEQAQQQELEKIQMEDSKFEIKIKKILKLYRKTNPYATYQDAVLLYETHDLNSIRSSLKEPQTTVEEPLPRYFKIFF